MKGYNYFWEELKSYIAVTIATFIMAIGWTGFLIPNHMLGGGVSGIAAVLYWSTGLPTGISIFGLNLVLLIISIKSLGWKFSIRTIYAVFIMSVFFSMGQSYFGDAPCIPDLEPILSVFIGAGLSGIASGFVFLYGSSTGGTDIIIMMINRKRDISLGKLSLIINIIIVSSSYIITKDPRALVYSYAVLMVSSYMMDVVINGSKQSVQMFIFSSKAEDIADRIGNEIHRGVTFIKGTGWYNKKDVNILMVIARKTEQALITQIVKQEDNKAFLSINTVMGVYGKGFEEIKK